jgi:hypothetical protein
LIELVEPVGIEPTTSTMPSYGAPSEGQQKQRVTRRVLVRKR